MTMTIPPKVEEINIVRLDSFTIDINNKQIQIGFKFGYKDPITDEISGLESSFLILGQAKYNALVNANPPSNKTFKEWIRPLIYAQIANELGVPVGDID